MSKEEFNQLTAVENKFEFIISQKTVSWINLLDKTAIAGFLKFYSVHCDEASTITELRSLASSAIKYFRKNQTTDEVEIENFNNTELSFIDENLSLKSNNSGENLANVTFIEDNQKKTEMNEEDTLSIGNKIKNLLDDLTNNSNFNKNIQSLKVDENTTINVTP